MKLYSFCDWTKSKKQNTELPLKANEQDSEERAECGVLLQRVGNSEAKHVDTFNASDSRQSHQAPHKKDFGIYQGLFYLSDEDINFKQVGKNCFLILILLQTLKYVKICTISILGREKYATRNVIVKFSS